MSRYEAELDVSTLRRFIPLEHHPKIVYVATIYHSYSRNASTDFPLRKRTVFLFIFIDSDQNKTDILIGLSRYHEIRINIERQHYCWFEL